MFRTLLKKYVFTSLFFCVTCLIQTLLSGYLNGKWRSLAGPAENCLPKDSYHEKSMRATAFVQ
jgi:hypothetical protein